MKLNLFLLFGFVLVLSFSISAQQTEWFKKIKNIIPITSTREDIIKIFGQPQKSDNPHWISYELKEGDMNVEYSRGLCSSENKRGWNVPEFTLTRFFFTPRKQFSPKKLPFSIEGFNRNENSCVPGAFNFENDELGIDFSITVKGKVEVISFYPSKKFDYLLCK